MSESNTDLAPATLTSPPRRASTVAAAVALLVAAACGGEPGGGQAAPSSLTPSDRTVEIEMRDIAFSPSTLEVRRGEAVRFVFTNRGRLVHDAFIAPPAAQEEREAMARRGAPPGEGPSRVVTVRPGRRGETVHVFSEPGPMVIGCHQPGHYTGGMLVNVTVG